MRRPREPADGGRWEYLLGGMFGLVLGFIVHMSTGDRSQDEILPKAGSPASVA